MVSRSCVVVLSFVVVTATVLVGAAAEKSAPPANEKYCVIVSAATRGEAEWQFVVETLVKKHGAKVLEYKSDVNEVLPALTKEFPKYACFVAPSKEAGAEFVAAVHQLTRKLDDDPYTDVLWGILTGYSAADALRVAKQTEPLVIERVAGGTEVELPLCREGVWYCELNAGKIVRKKAGEKPQEEKGQTDSTKSLVESLNAYEAQLFVTSGHATERDWQIGFRYRNGTFQSKAGELFGVDTRGERLAVKSTNPKVYLPVGNCLMGHIDGPDAMALAFMHSAGVDQMVGYTVPTWYGYAGWGMLDYFVEQPGRYTLAEAFYANEQALVHRLDTYFPELAKADTPQKAGARPKVGEAAKEAGLTAQDANGLLYDRDVLAFYGDPAWPARMAPAPLAWEQTLTEKNGEYRLEIKPLQGEKSFATLNKNGSQRGGRPIFQLLPERIKVSSVKVEEGGVLKPVVTDNFLLIPKPEKFDAGRKYRVVFRAEKI